MVKQFYYHTNIHILLSFWEFWHAWYYGMIIWNIWNDFAFWKKKQEKCLDSVNCNPTSSTNFPILLYRSKKKPMAKIINQRNSRKKYYQGRGQVVLKMLSRKTRKKIKYISKFFSQYNNNTSTLFLDIIYKLQMILFQNVYNIWHVPISF